MNCLRPPTRSLNSGHRNYSVTHTPAHSGRMGKPPEPPHQIRNIEKAVRRHEAEKTLNPASASSSFYKHSRAITQQNLVEQSDMIAQIQQRSLRIEQDVQDLRKLVENLSKSKNLLQIEK